MINLIFFGPPGSGKGTQSARIQETFNIIQISTGNILRHEIALKTPLGKSIEDTISRGELVSDELVTEVLKKALAEKMSQGNGFIFDGFPRNGEQAKILEKILSSLNLELNLVINLKVSEQELINRLLIRGEVEKRSDDNIETIKKRLKIYESESDSIIRFYGDKLLEISGEGAQEEIFNHLYGVIKKL
jgi:adenylate kinase